MSIVRYCRRCGVLITDSRHAWYCPKCREEARKEKMQRAAERKKLKRRLKKDYTYNKNYGIETETPPKVLRGMSPASRRWATMSWFDLTKELDYYGLDYPDTQIMSQNNTLPKDFGLKRKKKLI